MDDYGDFFMSDEIEDNIHEITASYIMIRGVEYSVTEQTLEVYEQADKGYIYLVRYSGMPIGCVLYYNSEVVVTKYFDYRGEEVGVCR